MPMSGGTANAAMVELLEQVKGSLERRNIRFWLDAGTLLGAIRSGDFLPWEHDIDLGSWSGDASDRAWLDVTDELTAKGFIAALFDNDLFLTDGTATLDVKRYRAHGDLAIEPKFVATNVVTRLLTYAADALVAPTVAPVRSDASFVWRQGQTIVRGIARRTPRLLARSAAGALNAVCRRLGVKDVTHRVPRIFFDHVTVIQFAGGHYPVPIESERYLAYRYGPDWRTPRRNWVTERDDGSVVGVGRTGRHVTS